MKIEYEKHEGRQAWNVKLSNQPGKIGKISVLRVEQEGEETFRVSATDFTTPEPTPIPGSPFETVNHAKAALEYHFRNLIAE